MPNETGPHQNTSKTNISNRDRNVGEALEKPKLIISSADLSDEPSLEVDGSHFSRKILPLGFKYLPYLVIRPVSAWDEMESSKLPHLNYQLYS